MYTYEDYRDMDISCLILLITVTLSMIGLLFLFGLSIADAQMESQPVCGGLPAFIHGDDYTAELLESYSATGQRRDELTRLLHVDFAYSPYNGFYDWNGTWVVLNKLEDGRYRIWAGTDWAIGADDQLHYDNGAACLLYVSDDYEWWFGLFDKLWYPTGERYE